MDETNILVLLEQQNDNFPAMAGFLKDKGLNSVTLLLAQSLKSIAEEVGHRNDLVIECFQYFELVELYSLILYKDHSAFVHHLIGILCRNRTVTEQKFIINKDAIDDFIFNSKEELTSFLENNKFLISLYIFSMVNKLFFKQN